MRSTRRRQFCAIATGLLFPITGCTGNSPDIYFWDDTISLHLFNDTSSRHSFTVTISRENTDLYETSLTVPGGGREIVRDAFEVPEYGKSYEVEVGVDTQSEFAETVTIEDGDDEMVLSFKGDAVVIKSTYAA